MRVAIVGAGMVGAACAYFLTRDGHDVTVLERGAVAGGTSSRGEGNILLSDKAPGPELDLARWSVELWRQIGDDLGDDELERESKGGLVVASSPEALAELHRFADSQRAAGVDAQAVAADDLAALEPHLAPDLPGGVFYPDDQQVQPALAATALLRAARALGARLVTGADLTQSVFGDAATLSGVEYLRAGERHLLPTDAVINAAGTWGAEVATRLRAPVPVLPRRGFILVTEPLPPVIRHKVYTADYVANVASNDAGLETSVVVEGTRGGTVGASRERVGFDRTVRYDVVARLAQGATAIFPFLADVNLLRVYRGFRPYCPDHLPVIGADPRVPGVWHACGHEGAGIGLAPATGALLADLIAGRQPPIDAAALSPRRFAAYRTGERVESR